METITETSSPSEPIHATALGQTVLVLGMHRSGTSAISRVLNLMGMDLGQDLMPPAPDNNETGFWEHRLLQWINRRIFESLGSEWDSVLPLSERWWDQPQMVDFRSELRQVIQGEFAKSPLWGLKDPRLCFLLPLWRDLLEKLNYEPRCVLIFRNPVEVARSLEKRDQLPPSQSYLMWLRSLIQAERDSRGLPRTLSTYESLLTDWKAQVRRIGRDLNIDWPVSIDDATPGVEEFLRPSLRHHQVDNQRLLNDENVPELVRHAYAAVLSAADSGNVNDLSSAADAIARELDSNHPLLVQFVSDLEHVHRKTLIDKKREAKQFDEQLTATRAELTAVQTSLTAERAAMITVQAILATEQAAFAVTKDALIAEQAALAIERAILASERAALAGSQQKVAELQQHQVNLEGQLQGLRQDLVTKTNEREQTVAGLNETICRKDGQMELTRAELAGYKEQRTILQDVSRKMMRSRSWRWTAPIRAIRKIPLTESQLIPGSPMDKLGPNRWHSAGPAHFILPCLPIWGHIRVRLKLSTSVGGDVNLFFDTGRIFNEGQKFSLGRVDGELEVDQVYFLHEPVYSFRLDPVQCAAEFEIQRFEIQPLRSLGRKPTT